MRGEPAPRGHHPLGVAQRLPRTGLSWAGSLPVLVCLLGRVLAARARSVAFVADCLRVVPGLTRGPGDSDEATLLLDIGTGALVPLVIAAVLAAVSTGVTQASRVLDSREQYRALHLGGADVSALLIISPVLVLLAARASRPLVAAAALDD